MKKVEKKPLILSQKQTKKPYLFKQMFVQLRQWCMNQFRSLRQLMQRIWYPSAKKLLVLSCYFTAAGNSLRCCKRAFQQRWHFTRARRHCRNHSRRRSRSDYERKRQRRVLGLQVCTSLLNVLSLFRGMAFLHYDGRGEELLSTLQGI